ncbi:hypothetical protein DFS33DRAFT_564618 [Desarmillaria ectypa]|nr:hypothetical protein DFS33DRAFT_564618 [Desarmillaria ectypa]
MCNAHRRTIMLSSFMVVRTVQQSYGLCLLSWDLLHLLYWGFLWIGFCISFTRITAGIFQWFYSVTVSLMYLSQTSNRYDRCQFLLTNYCRHHEKSASSIQIAAQTHMLVHSIKQKTFTALSFSGDAVPCQSV